MSSKCQCQWFASVVIGLRTWVPYKTWYPYSSPFTLRLAEPLALPKRRGQVSPSPRRCRNLASMHRMQWQPFCHSWSSGYWADQDSAVSLASLMYQWISSSILSWQKTRAPKLPKFSWNFRMTNYRYSVLESQGVHLRSASIIKNYDNLASCS